MWILQRLDKRRLCIYNILNDNYRSSELTRVQSKHGHVHHYQHQYFIKTRDFSFLICYILRNKRLNREIQGNSIFRFLDFEKL
jgi:hypothetical protein